MILPSRLNYDGGGDENIIINRATKREAVESKYGEILGREGHCVNLRV